METGVPRICINTMGTPNWATTGNMSGSNVPPEISLTISAPASTAALATDALVVSTEIGIFTTEAMASTTGTTRLSSSPREICSAPGRVD